MPWLSAAWLSVDGASLAGASVASFAGATVGVGTCVTAGGWTGRLLVGGRDGGGGTTGGILGPGVVSGFPVLLPVALLSFT